MKKSNILNAFAFVASLSLLACPQQADKQQKDPKVEAWGKNTAVPKAQNNAADSKAPAGLTGTVIESMDVPNYTYLKLKTADGEVWAAVNTTPVKKGQKVTVADAALMQNFKSETLKRSFEKIWFGRIAGAGQANPHGGMGMMGKGGMPQGDVNSPHPGGLGMDKSLGEIKVAKATGDNAYTIAEVHKKGAELADKAIVVRAEVVKFNANIMGKNWVHLQDGTGKAEDRSNDLAVTTMAQVKLGDEVLLKGVLHKDRDFGAGYVYPLIVEDGELNLVK